MEEKDNLSLGIKAAQKGDLELAKGYLADAVRSNPHSEEAWLWLGHCLHEKEQRKYCYERVLHLNSQNKEARQSLDQLFLDAVVTPTNLPPNLLDGTEKVQESIPQQPKEKLNLLYLRIFGVVAGLFVCGIPLLFLIYSDLLSLNSFHIFDQAGENSTTPSPILWSNPVTNDTITPIPTSTLDLYSNSAQRKSEASNYLVQAESLMANNKFAEAIPLLDQAITLAPDFDRPYYRRATCYVALSKNQRSLDEFIFYTNNALTDINEAIAIRPDYGDYYANRHDIVERLAGIQDYTVDRVYLNQIAYENMKMAISLGTETYEYPERTLILDLISIDQCDNALKGIKQLIDITPKDDVSLGGLLWIESEAYSCLGQTDKALKIIDDSMFNDTNMELKLWLKAVYLYDARKYEDSLTVLNDLIEQKPGYYGYRYYLRSLIYYKLGKLDLAEEDLNFGAGNTWEHTGMFAYMQGNLSKEAGDIDEAIYNYQIAEASLSNFFNPIRVEVQEELIKLGANPIEFERKVELAATPIATVQPHPTARPLPITPSPTLEPGTPTSAPSLTYPFGVEDAITVDTDKGTGKLVLLSGDYPLFRFQPPEPITVKSVKNIIIHMVSFTETNNPSLQIYLFVPEGGGWRMVEHPIWGDNPVEYPNYFVYPEGDIYIGVRNWGTETVVIDNLIMTIVVETEDGNIVVIGQK